MSILNYIVSQSVSLIWNKNKSPSPYPYHILTISLPYPYHILTISLPYPYHSFYPIVSSLAFHTATFGSRNVSRWTVLDIHLGSKRKHGTKTINQIISQFSWYKIPKKKTSVFVVHIIHIPCLSICGPLFWFSKWRKLCLRSFNETGPDSSQATDQHLATIDHTE
jgi:hypothetical protein